MVELRLFLALAVMLLIPGWFVLAVTGIWRQWPGLQRWLLAVGISISFYPVLFYVLRAVLPGFRFSFYSMGALLLAMLLATLWLLRKDKARRPRLEPLEWAAVLVFGLTIFTRFWIIRDRPFPAWSDSVHHTLLTQLTAMNGLLPYSLEPYFPIPLDQYHLGLYALSGTLQWLAQAPAHTALLWTAQMLNALCGIGVYLVLDRSAGRVGAIAGAVTAGLLLSQPAFYVNWGRFTQIAGQAVLLIGWLLVWEALRCWITCPREEQRLRWGYVVVAAAVSAAVFLLHFRVGLFYFLLLAITVLFEFWSARKDKTKLWNALVGVSTMAVLALLLVFPALVDALRVYVAEKLAVGALVVSSAGEAPSSYFLFPLSSFPYLIGAPIWGVWLAVAMALVGLALRNRLVWLCLIWVGGLFGFGYAYLLGIRLLNVTNLGAVLIMFYLPIGLIVGAVIDEIVRKMRHRSVVVYGFTALALATALYATPNRTTMIEDYRFFVTEADLPAMEWIRLHTAPDALFVINTDFWLTSTPHGTDAGYWIPYFTGRKTTASVMIFSSLGSAAYRAQIVEASALAEQLEEDTNALSALSALGVDYVYIGRKGDYSSSGLGAERLRVSDAVEEVYSQDGVSIFALRPTSESTESFNNAVD